MNADRFTEDKKIDPSQLDVECVKQAERFFDWAQQSIEARAEVDRTKLQMDTIEARLQLRCRDKPEEFGLVKTTEAAINAVVKVHKDYVTAYENHIDAREVSMLLDKAVAAMEMKEKMLKNLITLHGQQYFAGPSVPRDLVAEWQEYQQQVEDRVNAKQKTRARLRRKEGSK
jgi:hypothetical protein